MKRKIFKFTTSTKHFFLALLLTLFSIHLNSQSTYTFNFTGSQQTLALTPGTYDIKAWGGDGYTQTSGFNGKGGYASGILTLASTQTIYIYVGGVGGYPSSGVTANAWTFNGGGIGYPASNTAYGNGGGASDVRTVGGTWDNATSLASRVIVAGGGGAGRNSSYIGGNGGGLIGGTGTFFSPDQTGGPTGGTQTAGGSNTGYTSGLTTATLGKAMTWNGNSLTASFLAGGGGGYYGGASGRVAGGGGSSYLGGVSSGTTIMFGQTNFLANPVASTGNGFVIITELCNITLSNNVTGNNNVAICAGTSLTLTTNAISNYSWSNGSTASSIVVTPGSSTVYSLTATSPSNCTASKVMSVTVSAGIPTLSINSSTNNVCLGQAVSFTATGANTYTWSNGMTNGGAFTPSTTSVYTVTGQNGCGTATAATAVSIAPLAVSVISNPTLVCAGSTSTLTAAAAANSYSWFPVLSTAGSSLIVSPLVNTIYTVAASDGTCIGIATVAVNANPVPTIVATPSLAFICSGDQIALSASGGLNYTWTPGNLSGSSVTVSPTAPLAYQVIGSNTFGCLGISNVAIVVNPSPTLNLVASTNFICAGDPVNITVSGANSYTWGSGANTTSISVNPSVTTNYAVSGELNGCTSSTNISIAVFIPTLSITGNTSICMGQSSTITASGGNTYSWSNGFTSASILVSPSSNTLYSVSALTNSGSINCPSSGSFQVQVKTRPTVLASASNSSVCRNENVVLNASGANSYAWSNGANTASISPSTSLVSTFVFTVTGTNSLSCSNTATVQLKVNACVGIEESLISNAALSVFPNPNNGSFNITAQAELDINITNELGQLIKSSNLNENNNYKLTVENLPPGIYFVIASDKKDRWVEKIIVTK